MRMVFRSLVAGAMLLTAGSAVAAAAEPLLGTWNLNLAKSQYSPGAAPKAFTRVFTAQGDAIDMEISGITPGGTPFSGHAVFRMDDKDYAITGVGNADTMAVKRVDASHYLTTMKKDGKVVGSVDSAMSADGKVFTQAVKNSSGEVSSTMVFDKQVAGAADAFLGAWELSLVKSQFGSRPGPQSARRVYTRAGDALDLVITGAGPDGKPFTRHSVFKADGMDYPITSLGDFDTMSVKRIDAHHFETTMKNAGKAVGNMTVTISSDGRLFTQVARSMAPDGTPATSTSVFEKQ